MRNVACIGSFAGTKKPVLPSSIIEDTPPTFVPTHDTPNIWASHTLLGLLSIYDGWKYKVEFNNSCFNCSAFKTPNNVTFTSW